MECVFPTVVRNRVLPVPKPQGGTIDVIGGTAKDSRRPDEGDPIPVAGVVTHMYVPEAVRCHLFTCRAYSPVWCDLFTCMV